MIEWAELVGVSCFRYRGGSAPAPYGLRLEFDTREGKRFEQIPGYSTAVEELLLTWVGSFIPVRHRKTVHMDRVYHSVRIHPAWLKSNL